MIDKAKYKDRFETKFVIVESGCWEWMHNLSHNGYGLFPIRTGKKTINFRAHRFSYELYKGPIGDGLVVMHSCDNPKCVNPSHLSVGTVKDNYLDCLRKGRARPFGGKYGTRSARNRSKSSSIDVVGEKNPSAVLKESDVIGIKARYSEGNLSQREIGVMYGVSKNTIQAIICGRSWCHLK